MNRTLQVIPPSVGLLLHVVCLLSLVQDINIQNMNIELVAQMFKNYQSNVLFHLEGMYSTSRQFASRSIAYR
jgi:DASH complex subunit Dad4